GTHPLLMSVKKRYVFKEQIPEFDCPLLFDRAVFFAGIKIINEELVIKIVLSLVFDQLGSDIPQYDPVEVQRARSEIKIAYIGEDITMYNGISVFIKHKYSFQGSSSEELQLDPGHMHIGLQLPAQPP